MLSQSRFNQYRIMWLFVFFDLPTETRNDVRAANQFRNGLLKNGFTMFQFSIYTRHCASRENAHVHVRRVKEALPRKGKIGILMITDRQFGMMELFHGKKESPPLVPINQLELF